MSEENKAMVRRMVEGINAIVPGMQMALPDDRVLTDHTDALYDGLYAYLSREVL